MKIVQIIPSFNIGGGELLAVRLCAELKRQRPKDDIFLISLYDSAPTIVYDEALASGAKIITLGKKLGFDPLIFFKIIKTLISIQPDVIHTHLAGLRYSFLAGFFCPKAFKIHTVHNMAEREVSATIRPVHNIAFKLLGWLPVALSEMVKQSIFTIYGVDSPVVSNGIAINEALLSIEKDTLRQQLNLPSQHQLIITIGRLCEQKNQALMIEAYRQICLKNHLCSLLIVGEDSTGGQFRKMLEDKANQLEQAARDNIHFLGARKDIPSLLLASDVFVLSSDWEGVPLTVLEAMGYGVPVVCTAVGGIPDIINNGDNGLLVTAGNKNELAEAILKVLKDTMLAEKLSSNAKDTFNIGFSIEKSALSYLEIYSRNLKNTEYL